MSNLTNAPKVYSKYKLLPGENGVYIGRPSKWGNPFVMSKDVNFLRSWTDYKKKQK